MLYRPRKAQVPHLHRQTKNVVEAFARALVESWEECVFE